MERLTNAFLDAHPEDAARILERLAADDLARFLLVCPPEGAARTVQHMEPSSVALSLSQIDSDQAARIVMHMSTDHAVLILRRMGSSERDALLSALDKDSAEGLQRRLRYPEGAAGAWMDPFVLTLPVDLSVGDALDRVRTSSKSVAHYLYVVDRHHALVGVLTLRELLQANMSDLISSVMRRGVITVSASRPVEDLVRNPYWRNFHTLPLVDDNGLFLGIVRYEVVRRLQDELMRKVQTTGALDTLLSLGELYWIGLSGVLRGVGQRAGSEPSGR